ncbi:MAG: universal stress protein [Burkholderiales bacterium]
MARILIPFAEPDGALRAVARILDEPPGPRLSVHLLAAVEPLRPGKVRMFVSADAAEAQVRDAARRWLAPLEAALRAVGAEVTTEISLGPPRATIRAATARPGFDRVILPSEVPREYERAASRVATPHAATRAASA